MEANCYIKNNDDKIGEFDARLDEGIFIWYSHNNKGYRFYNKNSRSIVDCIDVKVDEHTTFEDK